VDISFLTYEILDSTNTEALKRAREGADEGLCIVARQQTAGRGRRGRTWVSEKDAGLYFTIILRPQIDAEHLPLITLMAGIAVHDLLASYRLHPDIKWVNDVTVNDKKIAGILAEATETDSGIAVVLGIGINIAAPSAHLPNATCLKDEGAAGDLSRSFLANELAKFIQYWYQELNTEDGKAKVIKHLSLRSSYFSGKPVKVALEHETLTGVTDGLESTGALRVKRPDGSVAIIHAGDVELLRSGEPLS